MNFPSCSPTNSISRTLRSRILSALGGGRLMGERSCIVTPFKAFRAFASSPADNCPSTSTRILYFLCALLDLRVSTSERSLQCERATATRPSALLLISASRAERSIERFLGATISRMNGRPVPIQRASISSLPAPCSTASSASNASIAGLPISSSTESRYCLPVKLHFSQPAPLQARQFQ